MNVENHKEEVPFAHYEQLFRSLNPQDALTRLNDIGWDGKEFTVTLLGRPFAIAHPDYTIRVLDGGAIPPLPTQTFLLRYLLESKQVPWNGTWKTFREMPWGEMYIKPYTGRVLTRAASATSSTWKARCRRPMASGSLGRRGALGFSNTSSVVSPSRSIRR